MARANIPGQISKGGKELKKVMQGHLEVIAQGLIFSIRKNYIKLTPANKVNAAKGVKASGMAKYRKDLLAALAVISHDAIIQVKKEIPGSRAKFSENIERLIFGEFEQLPPSVKKRITLNADLLIGTQIADLEKAVFFQFGSSVDSTDSLNLIISDLADRAEDYIEGPAIAAGSMVTSAKLVNDARNAFFFDDKTLEQIEAFQFMNGDPVSAICTSLSGKIFPKDDPNAARYTPPLHYNCKSWIRPIIKLKPSQKVEKLNPPASAKKTIQFSEIPGHSDGVFSMGVVD